MLSAASLPLVLIVFAASALVVCACGIVMTDRADRIADRTGLGEAMVGGLLLGAATSISGIVVSVSAALDGRASLAVSNAVGGIAAQTAFLALADIVFRKANLEHAAAEVTNIVQGIFLLILLTLPFAAFTTPEWTILSIHPVTLILFAAYGMSLLAGRAAHETPMWRPVRTSDTRTDAPEEDEEDRRRFSTLRLFSEFFGLMSVMGVAGWLIAQSAGQITDRIGLSASLVGALMTAVVTSLPELVTTITAVRKGALQLAVGGIIGGNTFDTLFLAASDVAYRDGSIYHAATNEDFFWITISILMTAVLLAGLVIRERDGPAGIGVESVSMIGLYAGAIALQTLVF